MEQITEIQELARLIHVLAFFCLVYILMKIFD